MRIGKYRIIYNYLHDGIIEIYELIRELELSRMIWVIELSTFDEFTNEEFSSLIILDSTASSKDEFPFLFLFGKKQLSYYMGKNNINEIFLGPRRHCLSLVMAAAATWSRAEAAAR